MGLQGKKEKSAVNHVAIDLGSKESQVCVRSADGAVVHEKKHPTRALEPWLKSIPPSRVILETSSEAFRVADAAKAAGHEVRVVPGTLAKQLGIGERGIKTDLRDARKLSEVSTRIDLPSVHIPTTEARELRSLVRSREALISTRTKLVNHARGWLRTMLLKIRGGATNTFPDRMRAAAVQHQQPIPPHIEQVLVVIDALNLQVLASDREMRQRVQASELCRRLMSVPGVGPVTTLSFIAAVDDVSRFKHAFRLQSYLGLTPGEDSSSERERRTSITKAGSTSVRRTLIQAAWVALLRRPNDPMVQWATKIAARRGKFIAVVALARKMAGVLYALWRDQTTYRPNRAAQAVPDEALTT
jgi:transposase